MPCSAMQIRPGTVFSSSCAAHRLFVLRAPLLINCGHLGELQMKEELVLCEGGNGTSKGRDVID